MTNRVAALYNDLVLGRPVILLLLLCGIFVYLSFYVRDFDLDASADSLLLENDKDLRNYRELTARYATSEFLFVAYVPNGDLFADESLATIRSLRDEFRSLDMIASVMSLIDAPLLKQAEGKLSDVANNYRTLIAADVDIDSCLLRQSRGASGRHQQPAAARRRRSYPRSAAGADHARWHDTQLQRIQFPSRREVMY